MLLQLDHISKSYAGHVVLDHLSAEISEGEFVCVTGKSGSGKSTLLNILGTIEKPDEGTYIAFGIENPFISQKRCRDLLRYDISYLFQNFALIPGQTVLQNLSVAVQFRKEGKKEIKALIAEALSQVGLEGMENKKVYQLSGGEQQRVAVARVILKPSRLILADEPTGSLDGGNRDAIMKILGEMHENGKTIVIVTHDPAIVAYAGRVIQL